MTDRRLDWSAIRPLNGSRDRGFEELCAQLARAESPVGSRFLRKGTPDAGVECYAVLDTGDEWGWQSKYFDSLGDSQWSQIDESVTKAIDKHPKLSRYFVCIPLDLAEGRIDRRKSAKERWDDHVSEWRKTAAERGTTIDFVYWGSHELLERLADPRHVGRVRFWFDVRGLDGAWFAARLDEALRTAGPRYTPEIHVELPIVSEFEAFGRTDSFFDETKKLPRKLREKIRGSDYSERANATDLEFETAKNALRTGVERVLSSIADLDAVPIDALPLCEIAKQADAALSIGERTIELVSERERSYDEAAKAKTEKAKAEKTKADKPAPYQVNPFQQLRSLLYGVTGELRNIQQRVGHADKVANNNLMVLRGEAGTGKTHLLCDVARQRLAANRPTVLLLGQRFVSSDDPWTQALGQLDMAGTSAEEFVGAMESAAQAAGARAMLLVDALNEGAGRTIWPSHLHAFLAHCQRSPWVSVVLSVRSSYEDLILPEDVRQSAVVVTHHGFAEHEYDATRTFFVHYGLELPSTPLLAPEFRNPLFLKTLCRGLNAKGERRLPRGFHGITAVFSLYLAAINERLAAAVGFDKRMPLVRQALDALSSELVSRGKRWMAITKAAAVVDALLPGREFERSLYRGMVVEGLLIEDVTPLGDQREEIVFVAYERLADHLVVKVLLDKYLDSADPANAFLGEGGLAYLCQEEKEKYVPAGVLEAMCVQIPERTKKELFEIAPRVADRWQAADAFRRSLVWRSLGAFSDETRHWISKLCRNEYEFYDTVDTLVTMSTVPGHPLNAEFLDHRLRRDEMADRDAWWSIHLHKAWGNHDAVDRVIDWASLIEPGHAVDAETLKLSVIVLGWMLSTSNRFLRDRATSALVSLLTGRLDATAAMVNHFADVDDLYVLERVYAVAYGVAMRCYDKEEVGRLADAVYGHLFAGDPRPHILLRDYARGVVERALFLGAPLQGDPKRVRPPYRSTWPAVPSEEELQPFMPVASRGAYDDRDLQWSRNRIGYSVLSDDFARYVIGTNSSTTSSHWIALELTEPRWVPPDPPDEQMRKLVEDLSEVERTAWQVYDAAQRAHRKALSAFIDGWFERRKAEGKASDVDAMDEVKEELETKCPPDLEALGVEEEQRGDEFKATLSAEHAGRYEQSCSAKEKEEELRRPPRLDLKLVQRYIVRRVFELGWTTERFGYFDRVSIGTHGRDATKAERMGKKYQWIAYHEILAYISDRFQHLEEFRESAGDQAYDGPWQDHFRDIDPSCTLRSTAGGTSIEGHAPCWWGPTLYEEWGNPEKADEWVNRSDDIPKICDLLFVTNPADGSRWLNPEGSFTWRQKSPADKEWSDVEHRELWLLSNGYLIKEDDAAAFLKWAEGVDFWGRWMPKAPEVYGMFLGEHGWAPASQYFQNEYFGDSEWTQPGQKCPVKVRSVAFEYKREGRGFDCAIDEGYTLSLPSVELLRRMDLRWSGRDAEFITRSGALAAFDPTARGEGPTALLLNEQIVREYLQKEKLTLAWAVLGEKRVLSPGYESGLHATLRMTGAYVFGSGELVGFLKCLVDRYRKKKTSTSVTAILRVGGPVTP
jgi:hypothetical protein